MSFHDAKPLDLSSTLHPSTKGIFFPPAAKADIVRSFQKDQFYKKHLSEQVFDAVSSTLGPRTALHKQKEIGGVSDFFYYLTLLVISKGKQTLGEEYCDLVQVSNSDQRLPSLLRRFLLVFVSSFAPFIMDKYSSRIKTKMIVKECIDTITKIHIGIFYFKGTFYEISKRIAGIEYIFNHTEQMNRMNYSALGFLIFFQIAITIGLWVKSKMTKEEENAGGVEDEKGSLFFGSSEKSCTLCLENIKNATATPCGHVFCWNCISEWCNSKRECPLDRLPLDHNSLVCLYNY